MFLRQRKAPSVRGSKPRYHELSHVIGPAAQRGQRVGGSFEGVGAMDDRAQASSSDGTVHVLEVLTTAHSNTLEPDIAL
jgi:hypothetical protein